MYENATGQKKETDKSNERKKEKEKKRKICQTAPVALMGRSPSHFMSSMNFDKLIKRSNHLT